jgi:hypothetical protein
MPSTPSDTMSASNGARDTARDTARPFARGTARGRDLVAIRIPAELRDKLEAERDRIEGPKPRSLEFYAEKAIAFGIERLAAIEPIQDPLA